MKSPETMSVLIICISSSIGALHSFAAMKLICGFTSGKSGRLRLNSVIFSITLGCGSGGAGARFTSFWHGNSPTTGQESISLARTCTDTLCLLGASIANSTYSRKHQVLQVWEVSLIHYIYKTVKQ